MSITNSEGHLTDGWRTPTVWWRAGDAASSFRDRVVPPGSDTPPEGTRTANALAVLSTNPIAADSAITGLPHRRSTRAPSGSWHSRVGTSKRATVLCFSH